MKICIKNAEIITLDGENHIFKNGEVHIDGGFIVFAGENAPAFDADRVIDAGGNAVIPGFTDTHTHLPMSLFRSYADDMELMPWLSEKIWPAEDRIDENAAYYGAMTALAELAGSGVTAFADAYYLYDWWLPAVHESGIRALAARSVVDFDRAEGERKFAEMKALFRNCRSGRVNIGFAAHAVYTVSDDMLRRIAGAATEYGATVQIHLAETETEVRDCIERSGKTPVELVNDCGILGPGTIAAHCVAVNDNDISILAETGTHVSHCPSSNLKLASGIAPTNAMIENGINVSFGTDSASSNNALSVWREMTMASLIEKGKILNPVAIPAETALRCATVNGAVAMGINSGVIEKGKNADLVIIDTSGIRYFPKLDNTVANIVYSGSDADVRLTMVGGDIIYENGEVKFCDIEKCKYEITRFTSGLGL